MPYMLENDVFGEEKNWAQVTPEQIRELRQHFLDTWNEEDDVYYDEDVKKIKESDDFCRKIIAHVRLDMDLAHKVAAYHLRWRRYVKIRDIKEESIPKEYFEHNAIYPYGKDKLGCHVLVLRCKNYTKGQADVLEVKRVFLFFLEKLYNEYGAKKVTMVFDCSGAGLSNMDIDFTKFIFNVFLKRYPLGLGYVLVYDMPWLFNAAWKIIKGWMMPEAAARVKMVGKDEIKEYIDPKELPVHMGGTDTYEYSYVPGKPLGERVSS
uniref:CMRF35-like molecule 9 n=1 Tax=Rhipicephalus appendiculatus TaxID=34631 RepID=A0A131YFT3_RHIAP